MKSRKSIQNELLTAFEDASSDLAVEFARKYFGKDAEPRWVGQDVAGVIEVNDHYVCIGNVYDAMKYGITRAQFFAWYEDEMRNYDKPHLRISLKNWRFLDVTK